MQRLCSSEEQPTVTIDDPVADKIEQQHIVGLFGGSDDSVTDFARINWVNQLTKVRRRKTTLSDEA